MAERTTVYMRLDELQRAPRNAKGHAEELIAASLGRWGVIEHQVIDERTGALISGHGRLDELLRLHAAGAPLPDGITLAPDGMWLAPVNRGWASIDDLDADAAAIAINRIGEKGGWEANLSAILDDLATNGSLEGVGYSREEFDALVAGAGQAASAPAASGPTLADRFLIPPFSVFDARQGYWQDRKRRWLALGIRSEEGRNHNLLKMSDTILEQQGGQRIPSRSAPASHSGNDPAYYWKKQEAERQHGGPLTNEEFEASWYTADAYVGGTSIFDPVLCEIAYRWWCPAGGLVLDPFAGGSVRGVTAAMLGRRYLGVDLSARQVAANEEQADAILSAEQRPLVEWRTGDSLAVLPELPAESVDFLASCPPYFDLEQYSDDPADLSNAGDYEAFLKAYREIIRLAVERLAPDRFACFVVGDIRAPGGAYRGFVADTVAAFEDAGCQFYNDIVLVTAVGSLALRAARIFGGARKVGKAHQNVLVFVKGDAKRAAAACAPVVAADVAELFGELLVEEPAAPLEPEPEEPVGEPEPAAP